MGWLLLFFGPRARAARSWAPALGAQVTAALAAAALAATALAATACGGDDAPSPPAEPEGGAEVAEAPAPRRGLWVLAEGSHRTLEDPARIDALVARARDMGVTDLFVQVHRAGKTWYRSSVADDGPWRRIVADTGVDPLPRLVAQAHAAGVRVHAWFNCLSLAHNRQAPFLERAGRGVVLVDRQDRSLLDYPDFEVPGPDRRYTQMGTPGIWLDPLEPAVGDYLEAALDDLIAAAPDLDGLHLDFIRYPMALPLVPGSRFVGLDFGYGATARERFARAHGRFRRGDDWDAFRRAAVGEIVRRLDARLPEGWAHSAAVIAYADRAYLTALQDWRTWLDAGWLDFAVAMAYTRDDTLLRQQAHALTGGVGGARVWLGLGSWLFLEQRDGIRRQAALAREADPAGVVLFSYDSLADADALGDVAWSAAP